MGRKNRKPPEPITLNIPVFYLSFSFFVSLSELWTPWRTNGFLFISVLHCLAWGLACCQAQVCVCWMSEQTVKECPDPCYAVGLDSCWGLTVLNGMNCPAQRKTQQWTCIPRRASQRIWEMDGTARRGLRHVRPDPADERWTCDWGLTSDNPPWLELARWGALVWILVFLGDLSRWKWHCGMQSHHLGTHLGEVMTGKRQYMPKRALEPCAKRNFLSQAMGRWASLLELQEGRIGQAQFSEHFRACWSLAWPWPHELTLWGLLFLDLQILSALE